VPDRQPVQSYRALVFGGFVSDRLFHGVFARADFGAFRLRTVGANGTVLETPAATRCKLVRFHSMHTTVQRVLLVSLFCCCAPTFAQNADADNNKEAVAILELAGATSTSLTGGGSSFGPNVAVEVTPIEKWLELEIGVTPFFRRHRSAEWNTDILFKKPWDLSKQFEFMAGFGPEWVHSREPGVKRNSIAGETALDLMYWPGAKRHFGAFLEPSYDYNFARGHERSFGITAGLLIAIP